MFKTQTEADISQMRRLLMKTIATTLTKAERGSMTARSVACHTKSENIFKCYHRRIKHIMETIRTTKKNIQILTLLWTVDSPQSLRIHTYL